MTFFNRTAAAPTSAAMSPPRAVLFGALAVAATMILPWDTASAGMVPTVPLGTSAAYSVVGSATVTNTGPSVLNRSLGLSPGPCGHRLHRRARGDRERHDRCGRCGCGTGPSGPDDRVPERRRPIERHDAAAAPISPARTSSRVSGETAAH